MSSDIVTARAKVLAAKDAIKKNPGHYNTTALTLLDEALAIMVRTHVKKTCRRGNKITAEVRDKIIKLINDGADEHMTCAEIAVDVGLDATASGRVSEIIMAVRQ